MNETIETERFHLFLAREDKKKSDISPNGNQMTVRDSQNTVRMLSVSQETQTSMQVYRAAATNTSVCVNIS